MTQLFDRIGVLLPEIEVSNVTKQLKQNSVVLHIACSQDPITWNDLQFVAMLIFGQWYDYRRYSHDNFTILKCNQLTIFPRKMSFFFIGTRKRAWCVIYAPWSAHAFFFRVRNIFCIFFRPHAFFGWTQSKLRHWSIPENRILTSKYVVHFVVCFGNRTT